MNVRAFAAIVHARLYAERRTVFYACLASLLVGLVQSQGAAAPLFFCTLVGVVSSLLQGPGRRPDLDLCEQSAPLFGRELARAKALVPCIIAWLAIVAWMAGALFAFRVAGIAAIFESAGIAVAAVTAATVVALSASIRVASSQLLYVALAFLTAVVAYVLASAYGSIAGALGFCVLTAFFALRQYGEALARYDPV